MSTQMNNNNGSRGMNGNNNKKYKYNLTEITPVFRPRVFNENNDQISFFIPRVDARTSFEKVCFIFHHYHIGIVNKVDFILKKDKNGYDYKAAYVHFDHFHNSQNSCMLVNTIRDDGSDFIYCDKYDKNKKWQIFINTGKKHSGDRPKGRLNLSLLETKVADQDDDSYAESNAVLETDYDAQIAALKAVLGCGTVVTNKEPGVTPEDLEEGEISDA